MPNLSIDNSRKKIYCIISNQPRMGKLMKKSEKKPMKKDEGKKK